MANPPTDSPFALKALCSSCLTNLCLRQVHTDRHLIPGVTFERWPRSFLLDTSPLLEEKWGSLFSLATEITDDKGITMLPVPAGEFTMGSDDDSDSLNSAHSCYVDVFYMDKSGVTNASYEDCATAGTCQPPPFAKSDFRPSYYGNPEGECI